MNTSVLVAVLFATTGCTTQLRVWDENGKDLDGVPFQATEVFVKRGRYTEFAKDTGVRCTPREIYEIVMLPTGTPVP